MNRMKSYLFVLFFVGSLLKSSDARADLIYSIIPYTLKNETGLSDEFTTGGTIRMVDHAADAGILEANELQAKKRGQTQMALP